MARRGLAGRLAAQQEDRREAQQAPGREARRQARRRAAAPPPPVVEEPEAEEPVTAATLPAVDRLATEPYIPGLFKTVMDRVDGKSERTRVRKGYVHVSNLVGGLCARQFMLTEQRPTEDHRRLTGAHRVMFKFGRAVESHVRDNMMAGLERRGMYGEWSCKCGEVKVAGFYNDRVPSCGVCHRKPGFYHEMTLFDHQRQVVGNPDVVFVDSQRLFRPVEIKSMTGDDWQRLAEPLGDHLFQAACYRRLLRTNGYTVGNEVILIYVSKHFFWGSPYKEFAVDVSTPAWERRVDAVMDEAQRLREARETGVLPRRSVCATCDVPRARGCSVVVSCFGMA